MSEDSKSWLVLHQEEFNSHEQPGKDILSNIRTIFREVPPQNKLDSTDPNCNSFQKVNPQDKSDATDINCTIFRYGHLIDETIGTHFSFQDVRTLKKRAVSHSIPIPGKFINAIATTRTISSFKLENLDATVPKGTLIVPY